MEIEIVKVTAQHAAAMFSVLSDPALYEFTGGRPPESVKSVEKWFTALESGLSPDGTEQWLTWIVQLVDSATPIGYVQATIRGARAEIAWLIGSNWQGSGYGSEAVRLLMSWLEDTNVNEVIAHIHPSHTVSQHIACRHALSRTGAYCEGEEVWSKRLKSGNRDTDR